MATSVISLSGQIDPASLDSLGFGAVAAYLPLLLPIAVMALPLLDLILAYVRRTLRGQMWYHADKQHLHHRMINLGHSHAQAVGLLWLWSALAAFGVVLIGLMPGPLTVVLFVLALLTAALLTWGRPLRSRRASRAAARHG
ncbi:MAG: hypothetical protein AAGC63_09860 [Propionicimonas sp.]